MIGPKRLLLRSFGWDEEPSERVRRIWKLCLPSLVRHRARMIRGMLGALAIVLIRVALPWPIAHMVKPWLKHPDEATNQIPEGAAIFLGLFVLLGLADFLSRYEFARFSIEVLRDVREDVLRAIRSRPGPIKDKVLGDMVARLTSDTARVREGLKGFFIHIVTSAMLCVGVTTAMLWLDPLLALVLYAMLFFVAFWTLWKGRAILERATKLRMREGKFAGSLHRSTRRPGIVDTFRVKPSKGFHKAELTRMRERAAWVVHVTMGVAFLLSFYLATHGASRLSDKHLLVFLAYIITLHRPIVRLSRQGTRVGKLMACMFRVEKLTRDPDAPEAACVLGPLQRGVSLRGVEVADPRTERLYFGPVDTTIGRGEQVALWGESGAGKTAFLEAIAKTEPATRGEVRWDGARLDTLHGRDRRGRMFWLDEEAIWGREAEELAPSPSHDLILLDGPTSASPQEESRRRLRELRDRLRGKTVLVALSRLTDAALFDRLIVLRKGQVAYDGAPGGFVEGAV